MQKMILINPKVCTGCRVCESLCSLVHDGEINPSRSRIRIIRWEIKGIDIPVTCQQCDEAPCQEACPTKAIRRNPITKAVETKEELCIRCHMCALVCPFGANLISPEGKVLRCDLCQGDPECVKLCETKAIQYIPVTQVAPLRMRQAIKEYLSELKEESL